MSDLVKVADKGHVRTITLNRPEKKNALSTQLAWGVVEAIDAAAKDDNVWVVALTGSGDSFCAGLDLSPDGEEVVLERIQERSDVVMLDLPRP